jgi:hypothetical protein
MLSATCCLLDALRMACNIADQDIADEILGRHLTIEQPEVG